MNGAIEGIVLDYGHGVRVRLPGCTSERVPAGDPPTRGARRSWQTCADKLDRMVCGR